MKQFVKDNLKIIDIGCGTGGQSHIFLKHSKKSKIFCLDISEDILNVFKKKLTNEEKKRAKFICSDAVKYFKNCSEKFDIIIVNSLHHIYDYIDLLDLSAKRLNNKGIYFIYGEPLSKEEYNYYIEELLRTWDRAFCDYRENKFKMFLYIIYAPFNFLSPLIHKKKEEYVECWGYEKGLDLGKILESFRKNDVEIVRLNAGTVYRCKWIDRIGIFLKIKSSFDLVGRKK